MPKLLLCSLAALLLLGSCRKEPVNALTAEESLIYITNRDAGISFSQYNRFSIVDSVLIQESGQTGYSSNNNARSFTNAVRNTLSGRGFTAVNRGAPADFGVQVSLIINTSQGLISLPGIWNAWDPFFWGGGFGPGWGFGSGMGWGGGVATYEIREGIMSVDIIDLKNAAANNQLTVVWNGLIRGNGVFEGSQATQQIQQLFEQAPYLTNR
jgi:hypothetical protein